MIKEYADKYSKYHGVDRRRFLKSASGFAAAFLAMNKVFGPVFEVSEAEAADRDMADERAKRLSGQFIFDDQTHFVRDDFDKEGILGLGKYAVEHWNPKMAETPMTLARYKFENYLKEIYLDSDTKVALLSTRAVRRSELVPAVQQPDRDARGAINNIAGSQRMFAHSVFTPGQAGWMEEVDRAIAEYKPDSWKGYTIGDPLSPSPPRAPPGVSMTRSWSIRSTRRRASPGSTRSSVSTRACCRKTTSSPGPACGNTPPSPTCRRPPRTTRISPSSCTTARCVRSWRIRPSSWTCSSRTGEIRWVTDLAKIPQQTGVNNVYGELGTTFATCAVANPRFAAAVVGSLVNGLGVDRVVWGTDSVWYGSPQWQIEAMRRLEIPDDMMKKHGWKTKLGGADSAVKRKIFGENSAKLYNYKIADAYDKLGTDKLAKMKEAYELAGGERNNTYYGYIGKQKTA